MALTFFLIFTRIFAFLVCLDTIKKYLKISGMVAISLALSIFCISLINTPTITKNNFEIAYLVLHEIYIGILLALPLALSIECYAIAGKIFDTSRGAQLAEQLSPGSITHQSICENIFILLCIVIIFENSNYQFFLDNLLETFFSLGIGNVLTAPKFDILEIITISALAIKNGITLAFPVIVICLAAEFLGAVVSRMFERLNLTIEITAVKLLLGTLTLAIILNNYS